MLNMLPTVSQLLGELIKIKLVFTSLSHGYLISSDTLGEG